MKESDKTKSQLIQELSELRQHFSALKKYHTIKEQSGLDLKILDYAIASSINGIGITDLEGKLIYVNDSTVKMWGYDSKEDILGRHLFEFWEGDGIRRTVQALGQEEGRVGQDIGKRKDGSLFDVQFSASIIKDEEGNPLYMFGSFIDITKQKITEKALQESERKFRELFEKATDGIAYLSPSGIILEVNQAAVKIYGGSKKEMTGKHFKDLGFFKIKDLPVMLSRFKEILAGKMNPVSIHIKNKKGAEFHLEVSGSLLQRERNIVGILIVARDLSERQLAEEQILVANERLQYLLSATSAVIYTAKASGDYGATFISDNVTQMVGYEPREFILDSSFWIDRIHPDDLQKVSQAMSLLFKKGYHNYEYRFKYKDGPYIWVNDAMKLMRDEAGKPIEIVGYWIDISERKKMEKKLQKAHGALEKRVEERTAELMKTNIQMKQEIKDRKQAESALKESELKLQEQKLALEQKNIALGEIVTQIEIEKIKIKDNIASNITTVLLPFIEKCKTDKATEKHIKLIKHHLEGLTSSFGTEISDRRINLTPREIEICSMIKGGLLNKDISRLLNISNQTVEGHRKNIRRKFGIIKKKVNLTSFLREL